MQGCESAVSTQYSGPPWHSASMLFCFCGFFLGGFLLFKTSSGCVSVLGGWLVVGLEMAGGF
jgi:uncharacterized protein involved in response to NO